MDAEGIHTSPDKVKAIMEAPRPNNQQQLLAFLGLVNYYGKFLPALTTTTHPLNNLLRHNIKWKWTSECETAFHKLKEQLSSNSVLAHYTATLPLWMACDASQYGVGAVISHTMPDGSERPIAYGFRTLSKAEKNYAQIEKEALAIIFGIKKFHQYVYGQKFKLLTDHKPLTTILSPKASLPALAAARLQRWAIILSTYQYEVEFRPTQQHGNADGLSRLPLINETQIETFSSASLFNINQIGTLPVKPEQLRLETSWEPKLARVLSYTMEGWPDSVTPELQPYCTCRHELSVEAGCLMWGMKVIVPTKLQNRVLAELHTSHPGIVKMKSLARKHVWWPGIDREIEDLVRGCPSWQSLQNKPPVITLHPWNWPTRPWQRVHVDFAGPFLGRMFLIVMVANSKWPEVVPMSTTTAEKTIGELRKLFAAHGLPEQLVSDNGAQFTSQEFEEFLKANGIKHIRSAPYHPATNGEAERFVQTFKHAMKAAKSDEGTLETKLARFLLMYRSTLNTTTGVSPAELLLHHERTRLDLLMPSLSSRVLTKQADQKSQHDRRSKERQFEPDQFVLVENHKGDLKWVPGIIQDQPPTELVLETRYGGNMLTRS